MLPPSSRGGSAGSLTPRWISQTEKAMITPMARRNGLGGQGGQDQQAERYAQHQAGRQHADGLPVAGDPGGTQAGHADDGLQRHHQWHDPGRRQGKAKQRNRGQTESIAGESPENSGGEDASHRKCKTGDHVPDVYTRPSPIAMTRRAARVKGAAGPGPRHAKKGRARRLRPPGVPSHQAGRGAVTRTGWRCWTTASQAAVARRFPHFRLTWLAYATSRTLYFRKSDVVSYDCERPVLLLDPELP
jgi:hypothetical protein